MAEFLKQFEIASQRKNHLPAYLYEDQHITLGEVNNLANQIAHWLSATLKGDMPVVGVCAEASLLTGPLLLSILKSGKVFMGLDPVYPCDRLRYMVEESNCALVLTDGAVAPDQLGSARVFSLHMGVAEVPLCNGIQPLITINTVAFSAR